MACSEYDFLSSPLWEWGLMLFLSGTIFGTAFTALIHRLGIRWVRRNSREIELPEPPELIRTDLRRK
jgi:hypothetical protein